MAKKSFSPIDVRLDEVNLSLLGYDIADAQARLVVEYDKWDKEYAYEIHWSIRGRFDEEEWRDRHHSYDVPQLVPLVTVPEISSSQMVYYMARVDRGKKVIKISDRADVGAVKKEIDVAGVSATLTAFDVANVAAELTPTGKRLRKVPIELIADPAACGCTPQVAQVHASTGKEAESGDEFVQVMLAGDVKLCPMEKERGRYRKYAESHELPRLSIELLDTSGFLLEDDEVIEMEAQVNRGDGAPMRQPRWIFADRWNVDRFSAPPSRVIARFHGGEED